ncbi:uncharacterized protein LOC120341743 [Styela clava]
MTFLLSFLTFYVLIWTYVQCRPCRTSTHILASAKFSIHQTEELEETSGGIKLIRVFNWTVTGIKDSDYDGIVVRLQRPMSRGGLKFIPPYQDCQASTIDLWIRSSNDTLCGFGDNITKTDCNYISAKTLGEEFYCAVDKYSDASYDGLPYKCSGSTDMISTKYQGTGNYYSLPNDRKSIKYETEFNKNYLLLIYAYKRQFLSYRETAAVKANWFCAETVAKVKKIDVLDAGQKCCEWNVSSMAPTDFQMGEFILDEMSQTLNVTVSWIPPTPDKSLRDIFRLIRFNQRPIEGYNPQMTEQVTEGEIEGNGSCSRDNRRHVSTIYNLLPNVRYFMMAAAYYSGENGKKCGMGSCGVSKNFVPEFNPCDEKWTKCDADSKCTIINVVDEVVVPETVCVPKESSDYDMPSSTQKTTGAVLAAKQIQKIHKVTKLPITEVTVNTSPQTDTNLNSESTVNADNSSTMLNRHEKFLQGKLCQQNPYYCEENAFCVSDEKTNAMTCSCSSGLVGNGISRAYNGTGCSGCPIISDCDFMANCVPFENPSDGFKCQCDEHHYGDGLKSGTGCRSRPKRTATIVVPVVLLGLIIFAIILWCLCFSSRKKSRRSNNIAL